MEDLPGNSHSKPTPAEPPRKDVPIVEKVITGPITQRKKSLGRRFADTFFGDSAKGVAAYVFLQVLVPSVKDLIVSAGQEALHRAVYGDSVGSRRYSNYRPQSGPGGYVSYNKASSNGVTPARREEPRMTTRGREQHNFAEILYDSRADAEHVLRSMYDILEKYEVVTVKDLLGFVGVTPSYTDEKWGWTSLAGSRVEIDRSRKYILRLPDTEPLA